jgi:hypothetical protein
MAFNFNFNFSGAANAAAIASSPNAPTSFSFAMPTLTSATAATSSWQSSTLAVASSSSSSKTKGGNGREKKCNHATHTADSLLKAAGVGDTDRVLHLLDSGDVTVNSPILNGETATMEAAYRVQSFIQHQTSSKLIGSCDSYWIESIGCIKIIGSTWW